MANVKVSELAEYTGNPEGVFALVSKLVGGVQTSYKYNLGNIETGGGSGEGGTSNYNALINKPSIGGVTLAGDKTAAELGLYTKPADGIPEEDMSVEVQASLAKADSAIQDISGKQDVISDLSTIRGKATSAYQKPSTGIPKTDLASAVQASLGKADTALQSHQPLKTINGESLIGSGDIVISSGSGGSGTSNYNELTNKPSIGGTVLSGNKTASDLGLATSTDLAKKQDAISDLATIRTNASKGATAYQKPTTGIPKTDLAAAVQASLENADSALQTHQDISGKQDVISDLSTIRSNASKGATAYQKPSTGIPKTDLASAVQTSLGKADTALQSHQSLAGYATQSWVEGKGYLTQHQDISGKADKITAATSMPSGGFLPNVIYRLGELSGAVTFALAASSEAYAEYMIEFSTGDNAPSITWMSGVTFLGGEAPTINANKTYNVSIVDNLAVCGEF